MALQKQVVPFPQIMGLDTKTDVKQQQPGYLRKAENIVYETLKLLRKRNGYDLLPLSLLEGGQLQDIVKLTKLNRELLALKNGALYSYSPARMKWTNKGTLYSAQTLSETVFKSAGSQSSADGIVVDNFKVFVWADSSTGARYSVQDLNTNSFLVSNGQIEAGAERPVVAAISGDVYVVYGNGANLKYRKFSILEPQTLSAAVTIASNRHLTKGLIDLRTAGTAIAAAYNTSVATSSVAVFKINSDSSISSITVVSGESAASALHVYVDAQSRIVVTYSNGTQVKVTIYAFNLNAALLAPTVVDTAVVTTCTSISKGTSYQVYFEVDQAGANFVKQATVSLAGAISGLSVFCRSVGLAADAFSWGGVTYVPTVFESTTQSTYFLFNADGVLTTKWANQVAASVITTGVLPTASAASATEILIASLFRNRIQTEEGNTFFSTTGVGDVTINFEPESSFSNAELAGGLHICAGVLKYYDGATVTEHGFSMFPEGLLNPSNATTGGALTDGNRGYKAIYKWTDNNGRDHRSAPTLLELDVILAGGTSTQTSTIRVPTLRVTDKVNAVIELYRTENAGTTYYKVTNDLSPVLNNKTVDFVDIVDTLSDVSLISKESLYTTGDVLENVPAPAAFQVCTYNGDRLVVVGENGTRTFFSKEINEEGPVEFTDAIYRDISPTGGPITAIINMASKLVIFQEDATFFVQGEGPLNTGVQDSLTKPEVVAADIGCVSPNSVVLTPAALLFKSRKGIWSLSGNLAMAYTGDRVEAYNGDTVTAASIVGELNQVRFIMSENRALVYNYNLNLWATFENHGGQSSIVIGNDYWYLREDGAIYQENRATFSDASAPIKLRIETGWLSPAELQGYARVYRALILATWKSTHKLRMRLAYDFIDAYIDETMINPAEFVDAPLYGADSPYGSGTPYGGNGALYEERVDFAQQKCTALKFLIEDVQGAPSEGLTISGITFEVGIKQGIQKLGTANQTGTE